MSKTILGIAVVAVALGAQVARADDYDDDYGSQYHPSQPVQAPCGPRPTYAPSGQTFSNGRYELQNVQRWVPGGQQQVWVEGQCYEKHRGRRWGRGGGWHKQVCTPGYYRTVYTAGHYETRQEWVWVAYQSPPPPPPRSYPYAPTGVTFSAGQGQVAVSVY